MRDNDYGSPSADKYRLIESFEKVKVPYYRVVDMRSGQEAVLDDEALQKYLQDPDIAKAFEANIQEPKALEQALSNSSELVDRGGFGIPTMFVDDDMYFGNHSMPLVELALGQASGNTFIMPGEHGSLG